MAIRKSGKVSFRINNVVYSTNGEFSIKLSQDKKEVERDSNGEIVYTVTPVPGEITGTVNLSSGLSVEDLVNADQTDISITLGDDTNRVFTMRNGLYTGDAEVSAKDGTFEISYAGLVTEAL